MQAITNNHIKKMLVDNGFVNFKQVSSGIKVGNILLTKTAEAATYISVFK